MSVTSNTWFDDMPVLGALAPDKALAKLRELGEYEFANQIEGKLQDASISVDAFGSISLLPEKAWQHTEHTFGYIQPAPAEQFEPLPIKHAGSIPADESLKNSRIKITLDRLCIADYPGGGIHLILFDFYARNQLSSGVEHLHFNAIYRGRKGEHVSVVDYPIFVGLNVGTEGVVFKCFTVNVKNDDDQVFLRFLDSDVFKAGLKLAATIQPALGLFSEMAVGITRAIATRNRNVPVQDFYMGLDFSRVSTRARFTEGSYIAVQIPARSKHVWDLADWVYIPEQGHIVSRTDLNRLIPYNYIVFGVSRYEGE